MAMDFLSFLYHLFFLLPFLPMAIWTKTYEEQRSEFLLEDVDSAFLSSWRGNSKILSSRLRNGAGLGGKSGGRLSGASG